MYQIHRFPLTLERRFSRVALVALALTGAAMLAPAAAVAQRPVTIRDRAGAQPERKVDASQLGVIDGVVTDTLLRPIGSADVTVVGTGARVVTADNGRFRLLQVPPGQYLLIVRRIGYAPTSGIIQVPVTDTLRLSYALLRSNQLLDTVRVRETRVSLRMLDFEKRRRTADGTFITREQIERRGSMAATDFLRNVKGLEVSRLTNDQFAGAVALSRREGGALTGGCAMQVLVDGIVMPQNFNLDLLPPPKQIAGIEVYSGPATIPPQFTGADRRCGLIAVWTRDGY